MIIFLGVFDYLYLKNTAYQIQEKQKTIIKEKLLSQNLRFMFWNNEFNDLNVSVYSDGMLLRKAPQKGMCINYILKRGFRDFKIVACKIFPDEL